jgi:hypothetical protein
MVLDHNTVIFEKEKAEGIPKIFTGMQDSNQGRQKYKCDIEHMYLS